MAYVISNDCVACGSCISECPSGAISEGEIYSIDPDACVDCGHVSVIIHRQAQTDSHLNNTSQGAVAKVVDISNFSAKIINDVIQSAENEKLDVAGVDLMIDRNTGQHYIIEVNSSPQLATGAVPEQKMKAYTDYLASLL